MTDSLNHPDNSLRRAEELDALAAIAGSVRLSRMRMLLVSGSQSKAAGQSCEDCCEKILRQLPKPDQTGDTSADIRGKTVWP